MTATELLKSVVPESLRDAARAHHRSHDKQADGEHVGDNNAQGQASEHHEADDARRHSSLASFVAQVEQDSRPLAPHEIAQDSERKQLGKSALLRIDDFDLIKTLGTGTFARVWLAKFKQGDLSQHNQVFALKVLRKADVVRLKQVEHVQNERTTLAAASGHPFVSTLICTFRDRESVYMCMTYSPGGELFTYLRRKRKFDEPTARFYAAEITMVFEFLHETLGIVYRDLKPENILLDASGHVKLVDFGFAKKLANKETYTLCGTPEYLAPEVIKNTGHSIGTDWWALGILIYEFLVGQPPFWDQNPMKIYHRIVECRLKFPIADKLSDDAESIIGGLIQAQPSRRLGCIAGGARTVKEHPWFTDVDWEALYYKKVEAPIIPKVSGADDSGNFDDYPDENMKERKDYTDRMRKQYDSAFDSF